MKSSRDREAPKVGRARRAARQAALLALGAALFLLATASPALAASATTEPASLIRSSSATLRAQIDPEGDPGITECKFEYVTQAAFEATGFTNLSSGGSVSCSGAPPYTTPAEVSAAIADLSAGETYRFRVVAVTTSSGTLNGTHLSFTTYHGQIAAFGPDGTEGSFFGEDGLFSSSLGFDQATRRLYVPDFGPPEIYGFDASAPPAFPLLAGFEPLVPPNGFAPRGIAVDNSSLATAGRVYYADNNQEVTCFTPAGEPCLSFEPIEIPTGEVGTAVVDSAGHLWVEGRAASFGVRLDEYAPTGGSPLSSVVKGGNSFGGISLGSEDALYVIVPDDDYRVWRFSAASGYTEGIRVLSPPEAVSQVRGIAVDPTNDRIFLGVQNLSDEYDILEYSSGGELIDEFGGEIPGAKYQNLAIDSTNRYLYAVDWGNDQIRVFDAGAPIASAKLSAPSPLANTSATLNATVNPEGAQLEECHFEYVTEAAFGASGFEDLSSGASLPCDPEAAAIPPDTNDHAVSADISGLSANTDYRYRLAVANLAGPVTVGGSFTTPGPPTAETTGSPVPSGATAVLSGRLDPQGEPTGYHFEYGTQGPCDSNPCESTPAVALAEDEVQQFAPPGSFKLGFEGEETAALTSSSTAAQVQAALRALPSISGPNVTVKGGRTYGDSPATFTATFSGALGGKDVPALKGTGTFPVATSIPGGDPGSELRLVASRVSGLAPETTYHYRLVADNGNPDGPAAGGDMTLTTHPAAPPKNTEFPSPPGSDRAYEQVSIPDSGGNPSAFALAFSKDGNRAVYSISGGTPISGSGTFFSQLLSERTAKGWQPTNVTPRSLFEPTAPDWFFFPNPGLTEFVGYNTNGLFPAPGELQNLWRLKPPAGPYTQLASVLVEHSSSFFEASEDVSRVVSVIEDDLDPAHPADESEMHLYDISSGTPQLLSLLPGGGVPACGVPANDLNVGAGPEEGYNQYYLGKRRWLSPDGARAFFPSRGNSCGGPTELYLREIEAGETKLVSAPPLSGPSCTASFIRATAEAAFFATGARLSADDVTGQGGSCGRGSVYRYEIGAESLECVTCVVPGIDIDVKGGSPAGYGPLREIGVSEDGSALYFGSEERLLPDAPAAGGTYRVEVSTGELDYVAPAGGHGDALGTASAISADGEVLVFRSDDARLDPQGGYDNGGFPNYYRYDHGDGSLICVSCPPDGSPARGEVVGWAGRFDTGSLSASTTYNGSPLSADGGILAFSTPSALLNVDQNTAPQGKNPNYGQDVYEWRNGRALLITDGLTNWSAGDDDGISYPFGLAPEPAAVSPDGKNVFFFASARYTADALDDYRRLYTARLGGGIVFPEPPRPCPLEVCQGTPKGVPEEQEPGSSNFKGLGNKQAEPKARRCPKGKRRITRKGKARCVKPRPRRKAKANHDRGAAR
jgi:hypothetical protein